MRITQRQLGACVLEGLAMMNIPRPTDEAFSRLVEDLGNIQNTAETAVWLKKAADLYGLRNIAYLGINIPKIAEVTPYLAVTYSSAWVAHYRAQDFVKSDPVIRSGFLSILPLDWRRLNWGPAPARQIVRDSLDFGVGRQGLTFPIRGRLGEKALLTITSDEPEPRWDKTVQRFMRDFQGLAYHVHHAILQVEGVLYGTTTSLTKREWECLTWASRGKTVFETAIILSISDRTVRFYLDLARTKLGATNVAHAVAKALSMELIARS
jgi:DNA-binding CsgD family transcriptional regulator